MLSSRFVIKAVAILLVFWIGVILLVAKSLLHSGEPEEHVLRRLTQALNDLDLLKKQNEELRNLINEFRKTSVTDTKSDILSTIEDKVKNSDKLINIMEEQKKNLVSHSSPSLSQQLLQRLAYDDIKEIMYFIKSEIKNLQNVLPEKHHSKVNNMYSGIQERQMAALIDLEKLSDSQNNWRETEAKDLSNLVQKRIRKLQNPNDCSSARKLICTLDKGCGFGCQIHHLLYCFLVAYGSDRTLVLSSNKWRYARNGWESIYKPLSDTCKTTHGKTKSPWPGTPDIQVVSLPVVDILSPRPNYLPLSIPADLSERLTRLHGNPFVWWIGQFLKYLLRPQESLEKYLEESLQKFDFQHPIVGVHVRRTDKIGTEAAYHNINEYMEHVEDYYTKLAMTQSVPVRRVYLATDDPSVLEEAKKQFSNYTFIGDTKIAQSASVSRRYNDKSLLGVILDVHALSQTDYLVCTFSSQVCRIGYEIMQALHPDASGYFHSLDDIYYFGGQHAHNQIARFDHVAQNPDEFSMKKGDLIGIAGNHWDGYSKGVNRESGKSGLYPSFKTVEKVETVKMPKYPDDES